MLIWPALAVFDLDHTLISRPRFRRGPPFVPVNGGLEGVRAADGKQLDLFPDARRVLSELADASIPAAIISRTHRAAWVHEWLSLIRIDEQRSFEDVIGPVVIRDGSKR